MKAVIQRVIRASVTAEGRVTGSIGRGITVLLGVGKNDTEETCRALAKKISKLRIFSDSEGKTNLSLSDIGGEILAISQFTLFGDVSHQNRPSFFDAAPAEPANRLYEVFCDELALLGFKPQKGVFGAYMQIDQLSDGPFTIILEM